MQENDAQNNLPSDGDNSPDRKPPNSPFNKFGLFIPPYRYAPKRPVDKLPENLKEIKLAGQPVVKIPKGNFISWVDLKNAKPRSEQPETSPPIEPDLDIQAKTVDDWEKVVPTIGNDQPLYDKQANDKILEQPVMQDKIIAHSELENKELQNKAKGTERDNSVPPPPKHSKGPKPVDKFVPDNTKGLLRELLRISPNYEARNQFYVFMVGVLLTPLTLAGSLFGFVRSYNRFYRYSMRFPDFYPMSKITRKAMVIGGAIVWVFLIALIIALIPVIFVVSRVGYWIVTYLVANAIVSSMVFGTFKLWQVGVTNRITEGNKFGSARLGREDELLPYNNATGIYFGGRYFYPKQGHILTVAGSRSGKFTSLIAPNLLGMADIDGSWVIIDPKGEICAVTHEYQKNNGQNVVVLNPWGIIDTHVPAAQSYNPLDAVEKTSQHLVDDCYMLAEMLVPVENGRNKFFSDSARSIISGLIVYIAVHKEGDERTLGQLWKYVRYTGDMWTRILAEMENSEDELHAEALLFAASEIQKMSLSGGNTWGSILATVLQATDFLKSPALQKGMQSGFDPKTLAHSKTTLYVIIPADKLQSHSRWLRLVVTSSMRAVIRKPNKRVVFALDEFAALGTLPEIEIALGTYAGFNITVWAICQSLVQLQNLYDKNWEVFVANAAVRHFFGINNNFDAEYISKAIGTTSHTLVTRSWFGVRDATSNPRPLITPDEIRIESGDKLFTFVDNIPPVMLLKQPYFTIPMLNDVAGENPYLRR